MPPNSRPRTLPRRADKAEDEKESRRFPEEPQENLLYFIEKNAPLLEPWQREIVRIVRKVAQYFYPQRQTQVMNEGWATFWHHKLLNQMYDDGYLTDGVMIEWLKSHTNVVHQPKVDDRGYSGFNPYALGFAMYTDIKRICEAPTEEDRQWFPDIAGSGDWRPVLRHAWANFRDESFIQQYLSPHLIRQMRLFTLQDREDPRNYHIEAIHEASGYRRVRSALARNHDASVIEPDVQVVDADLKGDRVLRLRHTMLDGVPLGQPQAAEVMRHLRRLWGYEVRLEGLDPDSGERRYEISTEGMR